ncbi:MAG: dihydropteroate synthase [Deferrisomatales bacterium]|nr:dihydropteroate synthase [Deferrisomatales bacterium]
MILIAENLTVANPAVARALRERDPVPLRVAAERAKAAGAAYLDLNLGAGREGRGEAVAFALEVLSGCWAGGLLADTADPTVMDQVARSWPGEVVLNGYSGDRGREAVLEVAVDRGLDVVVLLMARGIPPGTDERLALAAELAGNCEARGVAVERLWFDPMVAPLGWSDGQEYNRALVETLRGLPKVFGAPVQTVLGLSNLTTAAASVRRVPWLQQVFLALAAGAGLTHVLADVCDPGIVRVVRALEVFQGQRLYAAGEMEGENG